MNQQARSAGSVENDPRRTLVARSTISELPSALSAKAAVVIDLALSDALRKAVTTADALVVVGLAHCGTTSEDYRLNFVCLVPLHLNFKTGLLDVFGADRGHGDRPAQNDRRKQRYLYRIRLHASFPV